MLCGALLLSLLAAGDPLAPTFSYACPPGGCEGVLPLRGMPGVAERPSLAALLTNGEISFAARVQALEKAKKTVRVQALIFTADEAGLYVSELLKKKKKEGLDVRVIVDATSNLSWQTQWMYFDLKQHGIEVEGYESMYLAALGEEVKASDPLRANKRFHDKMWIIDGETDEGVAIIGGMNIANEYFRIDPKDSIERWRDQDMFLTGGIVADVVNCFERNYQYFKQIKEKLPAAINPDNSWKLTRATLDKVAKIKVPFWPKKHLVAEVEKAAQRPVELAFQPFVGRFVQSRPRLEETYIRQTYGELIRSATKSILIANAYFLPPKELVAELYAAVQRGVKVTVITNSAKTNDIAQIAVLSRHQYRSLIGGGIDMYEWIGAELNEGTLHAKLAVFDDTTAIVGSYNLDPRSEKLNSETVLAFRSSALAGELAEIFRTQDLPKARKVTEAEAKKYENPPELKKKFEILFALPIRDYL